MIFLSFKNPKLKAGPSSGRVSRTLPVEPFALTFSENATATGRILVSQPATTIPVGPPPPNTRNNTTIKIISPAVYSWSWLFLF